MSQLRDTSLTAGDRVFALHVHIIIITINQLSYMIPKP